MILPWVLFVLSVALMAVGLAGMARITLKGEEDQRGVQLFVFFITSVLGMVLVIMLIVWSIRSYYVIITTILLGL